MNRLQKLKVFGPPGCGKTSSAMEMIKNSQLSGNDIAFSSFTKKARSEAENRLGDNKRGVRIKTLHSFAFKALDYKRDYVLSNRMKFAKYIGEELSEDTNENDPDGDIDCDIPHTRLDTILRLYDTERNLCRPLKPYEFPLGISPNEYRAIVELYEKFKTREFFVDYTDMLINFLDHGEPLDIRIFFLDEAQDLTPLQWRVINKMASMCELIVALGDDDQSIFGWVGSDPYAFMNYISTQVSVLQQSFRVTRPIFKYATHILNRMTLRFPKEFRPSEEEGQIYATHGIDYTSDISSHSSCVILYRNHFMGKEIRSWLKEEGIPYKGQYSPFERRDDIDCIRIWEKWRKGKPITVREAKKCQNRLPKQFQMPQLEYCDPDAKAVACPTKKPWNDVLKLHFRESYEIVQDRYGLETLFAEPKLELSTIHHAKGGEWDKVILITDMTDATYQSYIGTGAQLEHRVWYVAITRAKKELQILTPKTPRYYPLDNI